MEAPAELVKWATTVASTLIRRQVKKKDYFHYVIALTSFIEVVPNHIRNTF